MTLTPVHLLFDLIQVSIGNRDRLSCTPSPEEWQAIFNAAVKQALAGVCFAGVERLPIEQRPPKRLLLQWLGLAENIRKRNRLVTLRACELSHTFSAYGLRCCVLKGQGIAALYRSVGQEAESLQALRQPGDIDVWVDGKRDETAKLMRSHYKCGSVVVHHVDVEVFSDVSVEVHFIPSFSYSPFRYRVYRHFFEEYKNECFVPSDLGFCMPSVRFNAVYELLHIFRHVFHEGVGLRQLMDYYFVLVKLQGQERQWAMDWIGRMGLVRFARAVMYVELQALGLKQEYWLCEPDEKAGRCLLDEIELSGNFGKYDERNRLVDRNSKTQVYLHNVRRNFVFFRFSPSEVLWAPVWKPCHYVWRRLKGYL